jgi:hypothetical protein
VALIQGMTNQFRIDVLNGVHNLSSDVIMMALYSNSLGASISPTSTVYTSAGEVVGTGYTAGGVVMTGASVQGSIGLSWVSWNNTSFTLPTGVGVSGCMIYNASKSNKAILVLNFGVDQFPNASNSFLVPAPINPSLNAFLRLA